MSRFDDLAAKLATHGAADPKALAAYIGRKKYGKEGMAALAAAGRAAHGGKRSIFADALRVRAFSDRAFVLQDCTVRSDGDGRVVEAYAAAFNVPAEIRDQDGHYNEVMSPGSFDKTIGERGMNLTVLYNHGRTLHGTPDGTLSVPIGVPIEQPRADDHGVFTVTRYLNNPLADSILDAVKQKAIRGQSFSGRFIQSKRVRESQRGALPTIHRNEVAWTEYGPTLIPAYVQAHVVGTRSADMFMAEILEMDASERADFFAQMVAIATPLAARAEPARESIAVSAPRTATSETSGTTPENTDAPTTPIAEPTDAANATPAGAGSAEEPQPHSARQSDIARRARVARITREEVGL